MSTKIDQLREEVNRLHAERGEAVQFAKCLRVAYGITSRDFKEQWMKVEALTDKISEAEDRLRCELEGNGAAA